MSLTAEELREKYGTVAQPTQESSGDFDRDARMDYLANLKRVSQAETKTEKNTLQNQTTNKFAEEGLGEFFRGVGTGVLSTARQSSQVLNTIGKKIPKSIKTNLLSSPITAPAAAAFLVTSQIDPAMSALEQKVGAEEGELTEVPETGSGKAGFYTERVAEFLQPGTVKGVVGVAKKPLTLISEKLYQSALKPRNVVKGGKIVQTAEEISKIGLDERVWLTKGGVERVANKIDDFELQLGDAIETAKGLGVKIKTKGLQGYLNEAKKFFQNQLDVVEAKKAIKEIDDLGKEFIKEYGDEIPIEKAQEIKVATGQMLRKYYDRLSTAGIEGQKQATRFLKEKIVEGAPIVGDINSRLSNLYKFDQALSKASGRIGNLNLLGLGAKFGAAAGGSKGAIIGLLSDLADAPAIKSGAGIAINELSKLVNKKSVIPLNTLLGILRAKIEEEF